MTPRSFSSGTCSHGSAPGHASSTGEPWPTCIIVRTAGSPSTLEFHFDREGNVTANIGRDGAGERVEDIVIEWSRDAVTERRSASVHYPIVAPLGRATLGPHGELLEWHAKSPFAQLDVVLSWRGQIAEAAPRLMLESPYLSGSSPYMLPVDLRSRAQDSRMRPIVFTGTVHAERTFTTRSGSRSSKMEADYRDGRLIEAREEGSRVTTTWNGDALENVTTVASDGTIHSTATLRNRGGHVVERRETGRVRITRTFAYAGDRLTQLRESAPGGMIGPNQDEVVTLAPCP